MSMKINFDMAGNPELPTFILATKSGEKMGKIEATNVVCSDALENASEFSFKVYKYIDGVKNHFWDKIKNFRLIWIKEYDVWFQIKVELDEATETEKTIYGTRLGQSETSQIMLYDIEINTENDIARDDYTEPSILFNESNPDASILHRIMEKAPHYSILHVDYTISKIQRTFSFDNISLYDAFQKIAEEIGCLFVFHSDSDSKGNIQRTISVYDLETNCIDCGYRGEFTDICPECGSSLLNEGYGEDTTIFITADELANDIQFSTDTDSVKNCFKLEGGDDLMTATIRNCNPNGTDYIWHLSDELKEDMSEDLVAKIENYDELYDYYKNDYTADISSTSLSKYNSLVTKYQEYNEDLQKINTPIQGYPALMTAYYNTIDLSLYLESTLMPDSSLDETDAAAQAKLLTAANISPVAVTDVSNISLATANSAVLSIAKIVVDSRYQVKVNTSELNSQIWKGNFVVTNYSDENDTAVSFTISVTINDDYEAYVQQKINKSLNNDDSDDLSISSLFAKDYTDFCTELKKYCLTSLTTFYDSCQSCIDILIEQGIADSVTWSGSDPNLYTDLYKPYYKKLKAISSEMSTRQSEIDSINELQTDLEDIKTVIQKALDFENYLGNELWLEFCIYRREDKYSNDNYISDGLTNSELFDKALEFIDIAQNEIYKSSELQHSISCSLKNLLAIQKFQKLVDYFEVGNWIRVQCDDEIYKLRLLSYEIDFNNLSNMSVEFSDVTKISNGISDQRSLMDDISTMATSYPATQRQASQGEKSNTILKNWVANGLDATATKIVNTADNETMSWDSHGILFRMYNPITDTYDDTQMKIIHSTLAVTDDNWETTKTAIGKFYYRDMATDGALKEGYGINAEVLCGALIVGEELGIYNEKNTLTFNQDGFTVTNGTNTVAINPNSSSIFTISKSDKNIIYLDTDGNACFNGSITASSGTIGGFIITSNSIYKSSNSFGAADGIYFGTNGLSISDNFKVTSSGKAVLNGSFKCVDGDYGCYINSDICFKVAKVANDDSGYSYSTVIDKNGITVKTANEDSESMSIKNTTNSLIVQLFPEKLTFGKGSTVYGALSCNSSGFQFTNPICLGYHSIRAGDDNAAIVSCTTDTSTSKDQIIFGVNTTNSSYDLTTLKGANVRLFASSGGGVYLGSSGSTAITSDENLKYLYDFDDRYKTFFNNLVPVLYQYKQNGHRKHIGFGARQVEESLIKAGLTTEDFAGVVINKNVVIDKEEFGTDEDIQLDELYSLRYEEFISLNTAMIKENQSNIQLLENRLEQVISALFEAGLINKAEVT